MTKVMFKSAIMVATCIDFIIMLILGAICLHAVSYLNSSWCGKWKWLDRAVIWITEACYNQLHAIKDRNNVRRQARLAAE